MIITMLVFLIIDDIVTAMTRHCRFPGTKRNHSAVTRILGIAGSTLQEKPKKFAVEGTAL